VGAKHFRLVANDCVNTVDTAFCWVGFALDFLG
jgi:hypothetical protein